MRHPKYIFILLVALLIFYGCSSNETDQQKGALKILSEYEHLPDSFSSGKIKFSIHSDKERYVLPVTDIAVTITNSGSFAIGFGEYRTFEKYQEDSWYVVPYREQFAFTDISLGLEPGDTTGQEMPLEYLNYELTPGVYRIVKTFHTDENFPEIVLATHFEIEE